MRIDKNMRQRNARIIRDYHRDKAEIEKFSRVTLLPLDGIVQNFVYDGTGVRITIPINSKQNFWAVVPIESVWDK